MPIVGQLRPGASLADAHAEIRLFQSRIVAGFPWQMPADWNKDVSAIPLHEAACAMPTRRAMRVDPLIVLREP